MFETHHVCLGIYALIFAAELYVTLELDSTWNDAVVSCVTRSSTKTPMLLTMQVVYFFKIFYLAHYDLHIPV